MTRLSIFAKDRAFFGVLRSPYLWGAVIVGGVNNAAGVALVEAYDLDQ